MPGALYEFVDLNGDGLKDALKKLGPEARADRFKVRLNTGRGFAAPRDWIIDGLVNSDHPRRYSPGGNQWDYFEPLDQHVTDFNGDGMEDLVLIGEGCVESMAPSAPAHSCVLESNGIDGFVRRRLQVSPNLDFETIPVDPYRKGAISALLDADGDGLTDVLQRSPSTGTLRLYKRVEGKPDLLQRVTDGFGFYEGFRYAPLSQTSYRPGAPTYPQGPVAQTLWVATHHFIDNDGPSGARTQSYSYEDGRIDLQGFGWLGFRQREIFDPWTRTLTRTTYDSAKKAGGSYPFVGAVKAETTEITVPPVAGSTTRTVLNYRTDRDFKHVVTNPGVSFVYPEKVTQHETETLSTGTAANPIVQAQKTRRTELEQVIDAYGNVEHEVTRTADGHVEQVDSTWDNQTSNWLIGLRRTLTMRSTTPSGQSRTRSLQFDPDPRTGLLAHVLVEPAQQGAATTATSHDLFRETTYVHNARGLVKTIIESGSGSVRTHAFTYDPLLSAFPDSYTNPLGQRTRVAIHPGVGLLAVSEDPNGVTQTASYDGFGRLRRFTSAGGGDVEVSYAQPNAWVRQVATKTRGGRSELTAFDRFGQPVRQEWETFDGTRAAIDTTYNALGLVESVSRPYRSGETPRHTRFDYDAIGRLVAQTNPDGTVARTTYGPWRSTSFDETGNARELEEDELGRLVRSTEFYTRAPPGDVGPIPTGRRLTTTYRYGPFSTLEDVIDPKGHRTHLEHDVLGRRFSVTTPDTGTSARVLDAFGLPKQARDASGRVTAFAFDPLGRLRTSTDSAGVSSFVWDVAPGAGIGRLASTSSADGVDRSFAYDNFGRLGQTSTSVAGEQLSVSRTYDAYGRLETLGYPLVGQIPFILKYGYTPTGDLRSVDKLNSGKQYWRALETNAAGQLTSEQYGNGVSSSSFFDDNGRLRRQTTVRANTPLRELEYDYYPNGSLKARRDRVLASSETFAYDGLSRLRKWSVAQPGNTSSLRYHYDDLGNLRGKTVLSGKGQSESFTYGERGAGPHAVTGSPAGAYDYRQNGNQHKGPGRSVTYTSANLPKVLRTPSSVTTFLYDASDVRVLKRDDAGNQTISVDGVYEERRAPGKRVHVMSIAVAGTLVAQERWAEQAGVLKKQLSYLHVDGLGSTEAATSASGSVTARMKYEPFGQRRIPTNLSAPLTKPPKNVRVGFGGHSHDDELALIDMGGRIYDPSTGRFLTADPFVPDALSGQSFNRYSFARNNPLTRVDLNGFSDEPGVEQDYSGGGGWLGTAIALAAGFFGDLLSSKASTSSGDGGDSPGTTDPTRATCVSNCNQKPVAVTPPVPSISSRATVFDDNGAGRAGLRDDATAVTWASNDRQFDPSDSPSASNLLRRPVAGQARPPIGSALARGQLPPHLDPELVLRAQATRPSATITATVPLGVRATQEANGFRAMTNPITAQLNEQTVAEAWGALSGPAIGRAVLARLASSAAKVVEAAQAGPKIKPGSAGGPTAGKPFPKSVRDEALEENPSTCVFCRMETETPQVDHSIARARGGNATLDNAQMACPHCNASKGARDFPVNPPPGYRGPWPPPWWPR